MKKLFIVAAFASLMSCGHDDCCEQPIVIKDQMDCHPTDSNGVLMDDSIFFNNQTYMDSISKLDSVSDLLNYLETIPSTHR